MKFKAWIAAFAGMTIVLSGCSSDFRFASIQKLEKKGKTYKAWIKYQEFAADNPKDKHAPEALFRAGWLAQRQLKDCDTSSVFYDQVIEKYPDSDPWGRLATHQKANCPDYFPLIPDFQWVEGDSETKGKNARIETICKVNTEKGSFPSEAGDLQRTYFAGQQKFKTIQATYKKVNGELQEFSSDTDPRGKIIFKTPVEVGLRWRTQFSGRLFTYEVLAIDKKVLVVAGEFEPCVLVKSTIDGAPGATLEYYAPGVGRILTAFQTPQGEKRNIELLSFKPVTDINFDFKPTKEAN